MSTEINAPAGQAKMIEAAQERGLAISLGLDVLTGTFTGYEELGIVEAFDHEWSSDKLSMEKTLRALMFVLKKREGLDHNAAKDAALLMKASDVQDVVMSYAVDEINPDAPVTPAGKDSAPSADSPSGEPIGA